MGNCLQPNIKNKYKADKTEVLNDHQQMYKNINDFDFNLGQSAEVTFEMRFARENSNDRGE